ncbi:acyl-CoA dehydrogenase family protein [Streptomyces sp. NPDC002143]
MSQTTTAGVMDKSEAPPTHDELIARARALRGFLRERQEQTELNTFPTEEIHQAFLDAGFYKVLTPKRYGGYELGPWTFYKLAMELARGCPSSAWCYTLGHSHAFTAAAFLSPEAQDELFADDGYFVAASFAYPRGQAERVDGGYLISGTFPYGSGSPYSNYYMGVTAAPAGSPHAPEGEQILFTASRDSYESLGDWGKVLGLRGSGSHSLKIDRAFVPDHWIVPGGFAQLGPVDGGTTGSRYHGNPVYAMSQLGFGSGYIPALVTGMGYGALDEYERILKSRAPERIPGFDTHAEVAAKTRAEVPEYQKNFGLAAADIEAAEAIVRTVADELLAAAGEGGRGPGETPRIALLNSVAGRLVWKAMEEHIWRTSGSSAVADGQRMQRYFRDIATYWTAPGNAMRESMAVIYARMRFAEENASSAT